MLLYNSNWRLRVAADGFQLLQLLDSGLLVCVEPRRVQSGRRSMKPSQAPAACPSHGCACAWFARHAQVRARLLHYMICRYVGLGGFEPLAPDAISVGALNDPVFHQG